ncbi:MAG: hypothetical protein ACP5E5_01085 [Acidobacteriaceae bacterium]
MKEAKPRIGSTPSGRQYIVQLLCTRDGEREGVMYSARIRPWTARGFSRGEMMERVFVDEYEMIATINPLLPRGSDVRDVFEHIESPSGFFYILRLGSNEAAQLGWRREVSLDGEK